MLESGLQYLISKHLVSNSMYIAFENLPTQARVWIYQADRKMSAGEEAKVNSSMKSFCEQWVAHGQPLQTSFKIEHNQFLIVAVDEGFNNASGCSIDGSVRMLKGFQIELGLNFLDPSKIAFLIDDEISLFPRTELKALFASGKLTNATLTFNNLVATKADFESQWKIVAEKSWMVKYLPSPTLIR
jgi:hypothetical protein